MTTLYVFEKNLKSAESINQLKKILEDYLANIGINTYSFTYYSYYPNSHNKLKLSFSSKNFVTWHKHYIEEGYEDVDSTLDTVYKTTLPTYWETQQQLKDAKSAREKKMRQDSIKFGAVKGLSIPIHGPQEDFANFLLVQMRGETCLNNWQQQQYQFFAIAYYFYFYLQKLWLLEHKPKKKFQLSDREVQCLRLIAKQYSPIKIAKEIGITERTVNYHIQRLNKKLGSSNKYLSLMKAMEKGLIKL